MCNMYNALVVYIVYNWDVYTCEWITVRMKASSATQLRWLLKRRESAVSLRGGNISLSRERSRAERESTVNVIESSKR